MHSKCKFTKPKNSERQNTLPMGNLPLKTKMQGSRENVVDELTFSEGELMTINRRFVEEMNKGWDLGKGYGATDEESSLKMISSHINVLPRGDEEGIFFAVDLGGTNLRVLRVTLADGKPTVREFREAIPASVISKDAEADDLFDFIAKACSTLTTDIPSDSAPVPLGFTFSFAVTQSSIKSGNLIEWTKGFATQGCIGKDPAELLQAALERSRVPLVVDALCNDTVGTLMANAYQKKSKDCRIGVILGTGTNAAYSDPALDDLIINIEWGGFNHLPRRTEFDSEVDKSSHNAGRQVLEKLVSGLYLGEITRLATIKALNLEGRNIPNVLKKSGAFETASITHALSRDDNMLRKYPLGDLDSESLDVFAKIGEAVLDRSAAVSAAVLAGVIHKATLGDLKSRCEVGIDGSVYIKGHRYRERLMKHLRKFYPTQDIVLDFSEDGSGMGAALVAAAISRGRQISSRK